MHILVVDDDIPTVEVIRTSLHWICWALTV